MIKGVSVYPDLSSLEEIRAYLEKASAYGFTRVFSSMFSVPGSKEEILAYFTEFIQTAHQYGMEVSLDVNPQFLKKLGVTYDNLSLFHEIGCDVIRLDHNYGKEKDLAAINNPYGIRIQLNASMGIEEELAWLKEKGVTGERLWLGHNFYPQRYTALKWKKFLETNERLSAYGFPIEAFVSSNAENTHGVWGAQEGLPTVEMMRDYPIDLQARLLDASDHVDGILIGNAYADEEELQAMQEALAPARDAKSSPLVQFMAQMGFPLPEIRREKRIRLALDEGLTENEKFFLFDVYPQTDFGDSSEWIWRSRAGRFLNRDHPVPVRPCEQAEFVRGDVLVVNQTNPHYAGEVWIARMPVRNDGRRNLAGHISEAEMKVLDLVNDGDFVAFLPLSEK